MLSGSARFRVPPLSLQTYLSGLSVGMASTYLTENARVGGFPSVRLFVTHNAICLGASRQKQRRGRGEQGRFGQYQEKHESDFTPWYET